MRSLRFLAVPAECLVWGLLAALELWPTGRAVCQEIPLGFEASATVPLFNVWTVAWNIDQASAGYASYWHAPIFYPQPGSFTFSEMQPVSAIVAPVVWLGGSTALAYNLYLCFNLALTAFLGRRLLRAVGHSRSASLAAAFLLFHLPFLRWQLGILQLTTLWGPIAVLFSLLRYSQRPSLFRVSLVGGACAACYAACNYYGLFLAMLSPAFLLLRGRGCRDPGETTGGVESAARGGGGPHIRRSARLITAVAVAGLLSAPILWGQVRYLLPEAKPRRAATVRSLSAQLPDYVVPPHDRFGWLTSFLHRDAVARPLGTGISLFTLALIGLMRGLYRYAPARRLDLPAVARSGMAMRYRWTLFCVTLASLAWLASFGPGVAIGELRPWEGLAARFPPLELIRSPYRFAVLFQLGMVLLGCEALEMVGGVRRLGSRRATTKRRSSPSDMASRNRPHIAWQLALGWSVLAITTAAIVETWPARPPRYSLQSLEPTSRWVRWLAEETPTHAAVACLPFPHNASPAAYQATTEWMLQGLQFHRPLANGYSGFFPERYRQLRAAMQRFPAPRSVAALRQAGVRYLVIDAQQWEAIRHAPHVDAAGLQSVYNDPHASVTICRLPPR